MAASMDPGTDGFCPCDDIVRFTKALNKLRQTDDRFIYKLNTILPTKSFKDKSNPGKDCEAVYTDMLQDYNHRTQCIERCLQIKKNEVKQLRELQMQDRDNSDIKGQITTASYLLKHMQREFMAEDILRSRSFKLFYEKCSDYYTPT